MNNRAHIPSFIALLFIIDAALAVMFILNYWLGQPFEKANIFLDLDGEANLPTWFSSMQWLLCSCAWGLFAFRRFNPQKPSTWTLLTWPSIFLLFSLDEVAQLHEWLGWKIGQIFFDGSRVHSFFWLTNMWMILLGIPFTIVIITLVRVSWRYFTERPGIPVKVCAGLFLFIVSAMGFEALSNIVAHAGNLPIFEVVFEESGEMASQTILLWAAYTLARADWRIVSCELSLSVPPTTC